MKFSPAVSLALAILLGVAALVIGRSGFFSEDLPDPEPRPASLAVPVQADPAPPRTVEILVASDDIDMSAPVEPSLVGVFEWPADALPAGVLADVSDLTLPNGEPLYANGFIARGEPILSRKLAAAPPRLNLSSLIPEGYRAVSITVTQETGVAGFILPGDRVDVIAFEPRDNVDGPRAFIPRTLLEGVQVLAVDQTFDATVQGVLPSNTVTLAMRPADARAVSAAARDSRLGLNLIGRSEARRIERAPPEPAAPSPQQTAAAPRPRPRPRRPATPTLSKTVSVAVVHGTELETVTTPRSDAAGGS